MVSDMQKEITFSEASFLIDGLNYAPFLDEIVEESDNGLHINIFCPKVENEDKNHHKSYDIEGIDEILARCKLIVPNQDASVEIFENYIIYQVRNESYCSFDKDEIRHGKYLIIFEKSKLLDYLSISTDAQQLSDGTYYPDSWKHYGIYTQNHIIDVISHDEPKIYKR